MKNQGSINRVIQVLNVLRHLPYSANLTYIATQIGMSKPGTLKILRILEENAFVWKNANSKQYTLGPALLRLGNVYREQKGISDIAQPVLRQLSIATEASAYITIWENEEAFLLFLEESPKGICYGLKGDAVFGDSIPIHSGASAKLLASYQDTALIEAILDRQGMERRGSKTITDKAALFREFARIRELGYAQSEDEYEEGLIAISVPIPESDGKICWSLSISANKTWIQMDALLKHLPLLRNGAEKIARKHTFRN